MFRKFFFALLVCAMPFASCTKVESLDDSPATAAIGYVGQGIPEFDDFESMVRTGVIWANADVDERREAELYPSLQSKIEDLMDAADDIMELPRQYPDLFEFAGDSVVRPVLPKAYACVMDTAGCFYVDFRLHRVFGRVLVSGQSATKESLRQVVNGEEPDCGFDYVAEDIVKVPTNKSMNGCGDTKNAYFNNKNNKLDVTARIYVYTATCCGVTRKQYMVEVATACYYRKHHNRRWRGHHTSTTLNRLIVRANGLHYVGGNPNDCDFDYQECKIDHKNWNFDNRAVYKSATFKLGEAINTQKSVAAPSFLQIYVDATSGHIGDNKVIIDCD